MRKANDSSKREDEVLISRNPATGEAIREIPKTSIDSLPGIFERAEKAQKHWASLSPKERAKKLTDLRETIILHSDELTDLIQKENGKPSFEAMINDLYPTVDLLSYTAKMTPKVSKPKSIFLRNPLLFDRKSTLYPVPLGVIAVISPWNFPFFLPFGEIAMGLAMGNAVLFKPSEVTPAIGKRIEELALEAGLPEGLLQTLVGYGDLGAALIEQKPAKVFFTGSVPTGKKIMEAASKHLIPVNLELGGKDAMVVLADADLDYATSAALWGGFANSGQVCASVERLIVHETIADEFIKLLKEKIQKLRQGDPASGNTDLGVITYEKQKEVYQDQLKDARERGKVLIGDEFQLNQNFMQPTLVSGDDVESLEVYQEETFGPVIAITRFQSIHEAIEKANSSRYGLTASVMTKNTALGEEVARQIEAGTVNINEVTYTAGIPETPWGGVKDSGFGRKHSESGFHEFVHLRHIHARRWSQWNWKSFWWYPYTPYQKETFQWFLQMYRKSWIRKLRAFPLLAWNFVRMLKREPRL